MERSSLCLIALALVLSACGPEDPEDGSPTDGGTADGGTTDGGTTDGGASTSVCPAPWPLDEGIGEAWTWDLPQGWTDAHYTRTEVRLGLDHTWDEALFAVHEEGQQGGEGASSGWDGTRWYRCDDDGLYLVAEQNSWTLDDWSGELVLTEDTVTWEPALRLLPAELVAGDSWAFDSERTESVLVEGGSSTPEVTTTTVAGTATVGVRESIEVPAGTFNAWRISGLPDRFGHDDSWWGAPHGPVQAFFFELAEAP